MEIKIYHSFRKYLWLPLTLFGFYIVGCAKIGSPAGGPRDIDPPIVIQSKPDRGTTNYKGKRVEITFDEFFQLLDVTKNFVSSPPLKKTPLILIRGKNLVISTEEPLRDSTTYRYNFGDAIADINEKNILKNYDFVFSTGGEIDSLSLRGRILNAFDLLPYKESLYVMLYDSYNDSVPRKVLPRYITKTDVQGWFSIKYIKSGTYMIFALKDFNQNYLFDLPNETIAFSDTLLKIDKAYFTPDSLIKPDTLSTDSSKWAPFKSQIQLYAFNEYNKKQFLKKFERPQPEKFVFVFNLPVKDSLPIRLLNANVPKWFVPDFPIFRKDSMEYWITDTSLVSKDTIQVQIAYHVSDSLGKDVVKFDTVKLLNRRLPAARKRTQRTKVASFAITTNLEGSAILDLNNRLALLPNQPVSSIDKNKIQFFKVQDDKQIKMNYTIRKDSAFLRKYYIDFKLEPQTQYTFIADSAAFTSIYNQVNDSTGIAFATQKDDYYGDIKLTLANVKGQVLIQMIDANGKILQEKIAEKNQNVVFTFINPGKYTFKAIYDKNKNGIWDTGNFSQKLQPEKVVFFNKEFQVRSNWSLEETWVLE